MADPRVYAARAAIGAGLAEEEETLHATPRRTRRSASGTSPPGAPPARLTGKTQSTKQLLFSQIEEETAGVPPLLTQAWNKSQYTLVNLNLNTNNYFPQPVMRASMAKFAMAEAAPAQDMAAGESKITVSANGSIQFK